MRLLKGEFVMFKITVIFISLLLVRYPALAADVSIYDAKIGSFKTDEEKDFLLKDNAGKKVVVSMVYTSCQSACPLMIKKLLKIEKKLKEASIDAEFVVVSFDSKFDSPQKMKIFRKSQGILNSSWKLLVGRDKDTRFVSNLLGIRYSRNPEDQTISHDNKVVFLDEKGVIVHTSDGLSFDAQEKFF